ncbi:MAG: hypothetical protein AAGU75_04750 [Bacillota bacterium]
MFAQGHAALCKYYQQLKEYNNITLVDIGGRIQHAEKEKIRAIAERQMQRYLKELLNALREHGLDLKLPVVFTGGGAELLGHRLYSREINTIVILDRFANAEGMVNEGVHVLSGHKCSRYDEN